MISIYRSDHWYSLMFFSSDASANPKYIKPLRIWAWELVLPTYVVLQYHQAFKRKESPRGGEENDGLCKSEDRGTEERNIEKLRHQANTQ